MAAAGPKRPEHSYQQDGKGYLSGRPTSHCYSVQSADTEKLWQSLTESGTKLKDYKGGHRDYERPFSSVSIGEETRDQGTD